MGLFKAIFLSIVVITLTEFIMQILEKNKENALVYYISPYVKNKCNLMLSIVFILVLLF
jgi:hypothetical protein